MKPSEPFDDYLDKKLQKPKLAAAYLTACLDEGEGVFLLALSKVAHAHGMVRLSEETDLDRKNLYRMLSEAGNPRLSSLDAVLKQLGFKIRIEAA